MKNDTAYKLNLESIKTENAESGFADGCKRFGEEIVKGLTRCKARLEFRCFSGKLGIGERAHLIS